MHCHYPMHLVAREPKRGEPGDPRLTLEAMGTAPRRADWLERLRAGAIRVAANLLNYGEDRWRVSLEELERGEVQAVFSVLYEPFAEFDLDEPPGSPPEGGYFADLIGRIDQVETDLRGLDPDGRRHAIPAGAAELDAALAAGRTCFLHCVEGGFHLGSDPDEVQANVGTLARRGVVYITLAHLFWREVATNAPAIPFLPDRVYKAIFRQPPVGLSALGRAAVEAMYEHGVAVDVSHMSERAMAETFDLLDELDRHSGAAPSEHPAIASHAGYRFGSQEYMLPPAAIRRIAERDGVVGLILACHQIEDGLDAPEGGDAAAAAAVLRRHVDAIRSCVPSHENAHVAIGTDMDGFIKPILPGIETAGDLGRLQAPLRDAYGEDAEAILAGNALRVARGALG